MMRYVVAWIWTIRFAYCAEFKLGMISPFRHPRLGWENNAAAATIAIERAQKDGLLLGHNISVLWHDDKCNAMGGTAATMTMREQDVDVFIGPPCSGSTIPSGLLASFWNLPMFSQASTDPSLADKTTYKTLVRLGPPFNKMGKAFVEVFKQFSWTRVVIISKKRNDNRNVFCDYSSRSVVKAFADNLIEIADYISIDENIDDSEINDVLARAKQRGRIIVLCTEIIEDRRRILLRALDKGMTGSDFIFILPDHLPKANIETPWIQNDVQDAKAKEAFNSVFQISVAEMAGPNVEAFRDLVTKKMADPPWSYNYTTEMGIRGSEYSAFLHDVVYLYLLVLNETLALNQDHRNGTLMFEHAQGKAFRGLTGNVKVDNNGDREPDYWVWDLVPGDAEFRVALEATLTSSESQKIHVLRNIIWETPDGLPPPSTPVCGFSDELCPPASSNKTTVIIIAAVIVSVLSITMTIIGVLLYRRAKFERDVQLQLWRIPFSEITFTKSKVTGSISQLSLHSGAILNSITSSTNVSETQLFSQIGYYKGIIVAVKKLDAENIVLDRHDLLELKAMKDIHQENVNMFIGLCTDERCKCILSGYCSKGSLEDIIENDDIKLDWMFKMSLTNDLTNAMAFLHSSNVRYHGNLKSSNCLVDNRWVLKVSDYGLSRIRNQHRRSNDSDHRFITGMFWTAPELLITEPAMRRGSQKADVYAYGIVLFEILYRQFPYDTTIHNPTDVIMRIKARSNPPFRPTSMINQNEVGWNVNEKTVEGLRRLLRDCWSDDVDIRPPISAIKQEIAKLHTGKKLNIVDNMVKMLEKYAENLEAVVEQRTGLLLEEKNKTDSLLYRMLPRVVANQLKVGKIVQPEVFDSVTIYFSDIVGFTQLASESTAIEIVDFLNDLYTAFDGIISKHDVYKVETIGDAYMTVSGVPERNENRHCIAIADMSLDLLHCAYAFEIKHKQELTLKLRIGVHTGPCAAGTKCFNCGKPGGGSTCRNLRNQSMYFSYNGLLTMENAMMVDRCVVGRTMPRYCLFGDTVNMASRMESTGEAMKIHISQTAQDMLTESDMYCIVPRGETEVKGKGLQMTYWLLGRRKNDQSRFTGDNLNTI